MRTYVSTLPSNWRLSFSIAGFAPPKDRRPHKAVGNGSPTTSTTQGPAWSFAFGASAAGSGADVTSSASCGQHRVLATAFSTSWNALKSQRFVGQQQHVQYALISGSKVKSEQATDLAILLGRPTLTTTLSSEEPFKVLMWQVDYRLVSHCKHLMSGMMGMPRVG